MDKILIILALIQLYANIRFSIMGIGTLTCEMKDTEVGTNDVSTHTHTFLFFF